jgi:GNAT superfamily N-acetyltransferase
MSRKQDIFILLIYTILYTSIEASGIPNPRDRQRLTQILQGMPKSYYMPVSEKDLKKENLSIKSTVSEIVKAENFQIPIMHIGSVPASREEYYEISLKPVTDLCRYYITKPNNPSEKCKCKIGSFYIHAQFQKMGIGRKFLDVITEHAQSAGCDKIELSSASTAVSFYLANGFHRTKPNSYNMVKYI